MYAICTLLMVQSSHFSSECVIFQLCVNIMLTTTWMSFSSWKPFARCILFVRLYINYISVSFLYILKMLWPRLSVVYMTTKISILTFTCIHPRLYVNQMTEHCVLTISTSSGWVSYSDCSQMVCWSQISWVNVSQRVCGFIDYPCVVTSTTSRLHKIKIKTHPG
jgi:hypothetical protein